MASILASKLKRENRLLRLKVPMLTSIRSPLRHRCPTTKPRSHAPVKGLPRGDPVEEFRQRRGPSLASASSWALQRMLPSPSYGSHRRSGPAAAGRSSGRRRGRVPASEAHLRRRAVTAALFDTGNRRTRTGRACVAGSNPARGDLRIQPLSESRIMWKWSAKSPRDD